MNRIASLIVVSIAGALLPVGTLAKPCNLTSEDTDKLACYDMMLACRKHGSSSARLHCYDETLGAASSQSNMPTNGVSIKPKEQTSEVSTILVISDDIKSVRTPTSASASTSASESASESASTSTGTISKDKEKDFGKRPPIKKGGDFIESRIVEVTQSARREDYFRLENGQVWREVEDARVRIKVGQMVKIEKGVMGSFNLKIEGVRKLVKVRRVN